MSTTYGAADQAIAITLASLAGNAQRESTYNQNADYHDILVFGRVQLASAPDGSKSVYVFAYGSTGGGSFPDLITGSDAALVLDIFNYPNIAPLGVIKTPTHGVAHKAGPWSLRAAFGEAPPSRWGIVVANMTATIAFTSSPSDHAFTWQGVVLS